MNTRYATIAASLAVSLLLGAASPARAAFDTPTCLSQRVKAWGARRECERGEEAKALLGRPADAEKCQERFTQTMTAIDTRATLASVACRYRNNWDGTVTDMKTGLMWVQVTALDGVQSGYLLDGDNKYDWYRALEVVATLNGFGVWPGNAITPVAGNAGYSDWRLPNIVELGTIRDPSVPWCGSSYAGCTDNILGPTFPGDYWSSSQSTNMVHVWMVHFGSPSAMTSRVKELTGSIRPVRTAF